MSLKIKDPDVARVIRSLRFHTEQSLAGFQAYIESDDGDSSHLAEALQSVRSLKTLLGVLELVSDHVPDMTQLRLNINNVAWDMEPFE